MLVRCGWITGDGIAKNRKGVNESVLDRLEQSRSLLYKGGSCGAGK